MRQARRDFGLRLQLRWRGTSHGPCAWTFQGSAGRVEKIDIGFPNTLAAGTKVWLCAFWFNRRKQSGNACDPISANLPGGGVSMTG